MVEVTLKKNADGRWMELVCSGHAEFSDEEHGGDIVCAAVSALTGYLGLTLSQVMGWPEAVAASEGAFSFRRPAAGGEEVQRVLDVLLEGMVGSLRALEENYSGWVRIEEENL